MRPNRSSKKGITLIEMVMAMVILSAVAIPTASMIGGQIHGMAEASDLTSAGNAARLAMEKLSNTPYASITDGGSATVGFYTVTWGVTETGAGAVARKDITVTAKRTGTAPVLAALYTSIFNGVTYAP